MALRIYGNRSLKTLPGKDTRPTSARVREALFNIWQGYIIDCHWLDLCTGSGAMGAEALCRGAAMVTGIEQSSRACAIIQQNWQQVIRPDQSFQLLRGNLVKQLPKLAGQQFDRIYFDPPYASHLYPQVLGTIATYGLLAEGGELAVEHSSARDLPDQIQPATSPSNGSALHRSSPSQLVSCRNKRYGLTSLTFYQGR